MTPFTIMDWRDRQMAGPKGYLTFRLYSDGWLVRHTPYYSGPSDAALKTESISGVDVWTACRFANDRLG